MKTFLKWIGGILLGLLTLAIAVPVLFNIGRFFMFGPARLMGRGFTPDRVHPMPMMRPEYYHMTPWGGWGGILMWLVPLVLLVLLAAGITVIVNAFRRQASQPVAPVVAAPAAVVEPARACSNCGRAADADWKVCPYCTETLA